jgi:hypothetical protein
MLSQREELDYDRGVNEHVAAAVAGFSKHGSYAHENAVVHFENNDNPEYYMVLELPERVATAGDLPLSPRFSNNNEFWLLYATNSSMHADVTLIAQLDGHEAKELLGC